MVLFFIFMRSCFAHARSRIVGMYVYEQSSMHVLFNEGTSIYEVSVNLKEYYEIVDEARPLSGIFPTHADFFTKMHF